MARIKIDVDGNSAGFHKVMGGVESRLHGLKSKVGFHFGSALAGLAGGATLTAMVENMAHFAEEIKHASDNLGVTTQRIQQLRQVARHGGKDLSVFSGIFMKSETFASKALVGGSREANVAAQLGITSADLKGPNSLNKSDLLNKMLMGTKGMDKAVAEQLMGTVVGKKNAGFLMGHRQEILSNANTGLVSNEDIQKLAELKEQWEDLIDVVRARLIPAINDLVDWAVKFVGKASETLQVHSTVTGDMDKYAKEHGTRAGFWKTSWLNFKTGGALFGNDVAHGLGIAGLITGGRAGTVAEDRDHIFRQYYKAKYGKEAFIYGMAGLPDTVKKVVATREELAKRAEERRKEHTKEQEDLEKGPNREAPVTKDKKSKLLLDKEVKGQDAMLRVGGLMTKDTTYNLSRLTEETNRILMDIYKAILKQDEPDNGDELAALADNL